MTYLCNRCGMDFESDAEDIKRECPQCNSDGRSHTEIPFGMSSSDGLEFPED